MIDKEFQKKRKWISLCLTGKICPMSDWDWIEMLDLCNREGIGPLLYTKLKQVDLHRKFLKGLKSLYIWTKIKNSLFLEEITKISSHLKKQNIPILLLKGSALIMTIYSEPYLRPMSDIDIMVKEKDFTKVNIFFKENGYKIINIEYNVWDRRLGSGRTYTSNNINIDLFTHLERLYIGIGEDERLFSQAIHLSDNIFIPTPEILLLHSLIHMATHHFYYRLIWLYDIKKIIDKWTIQWDFIYKYIINERSKRLLFLGLQEAKQLLGANVPDDLLKEINVLENRFCLFVKKAHGNLKIENITYISGMRKIRDILVIFISSLFPSNAYLKVRFGTNNIFMLLFYRLIRPFFVLFKGMAKITNLLPF